MTISQHSIVRSFPRSLERGRPALVSILLALILAPAASSQPPEDIPPIRPLRTGGLKAEVAALIMSGQEGGAIPLEVLVLPTRGGDDKKRISLVMEIGGEHLVGDHQEGPFKFEIYAYALTLQGGLKGSLLQTFEVDLDRLARRPEEGGIKFSGEMELFPGEYSLRVLVRRSGTEHVGVRVIPLEVPGSEAPKPMLLAPLIADGSDAWLELREVRGRNASAREPFSFLSTPPAAKAVIPPDQEVRFRMLAYDLESVGSNVEVELSHPAGHRVAGVEAQVSSYSAPTEQGYRVLEGKFRSDGLLNGDYRMKVVLENGGERLSSGALPVLVWESASLEQPSTSPIWSQIKSSAPVETASKAAEETAKNDRRSRKRRKKKIDHRPIEAKYREALDHLAAGDAARARAELFRQGMDLLRREGSEGLEVLEQVEVTIARHLGDVKPEALLPVALLHHDLYRYARQREVALLSTHSRQITLGLAELYTDTSRSTSAAARSADVFASLGCALLEAELFRFSERLFRRALDLEPAHALAYLGLGMGYEKVGDYDRAVDALDELVEAHPDHDHGRLRLAMNLIRGRRPKAAARHLRRIVKGRGEPWVRSLAVQELAKFHLNNEELEEAEQVLRAGAESLPTESKIYVLLAFALDAQQKTEEAKKVLEKMDLRSNRTRMSARHRYTQGPQEAVNGLRQELGRHSEIRRQDLLEGLAVARKNSE